MGCNLRATWFSISNTPMDFSHSGTAHGISVCCRAYSAEFGVYVLYRQTGSRRTENSSQ